MKILSAGKLDDVLRRKAEYDAKMKSYEEDENKRRANYRKAIEDVYAPIREDIEYQLSHYSALEFEVRLSQAYDFQTESEGIEVYILCNERNKFDDNVALSWSYRATIGSGGKIVTETSSWSGLKATTPQQLKSLRQTVSALEYLNDLDWESIVKTTLPDRRSFYEGRVQRPDKQDFQSEINEAVIEDLIGANKLILVENFESSGFMGHEVYIYPISQTDRQFKVAVVSKYEVEDGTEERRNKMFDKLRAGDYYTQRVRKTTIVPVKRNDDYVIVSF